MRKESAEEMIEKFRLRKEDKEKLFFISDYIEKANEHKTNYNLVITIDNMPLRDIDKYLNYLTKVTEKNGIRIINYFERHRREIHQKQLVWYEYNSEDVPWHMQRDSEDVMKSISKMLSHNNIIVITSSTSLEEVDSFHGDLLKYLPHVSFHGEYIESEEYRKLIYKYKHNNVSYDIKLDDFNKVVNSIGDNDYVKNYRISDYLYNYSTINSLNKNIVNANTFDGLLTKEDNESSKNDSKEKIDLNELIGLQNVKDELNKLFHYVEFLKEHNINRDGTYLNMFFLGNPGTGKTMIANIVADKLYELEFIKENEVVKVIPTDLIGEYVGQTRRKIRDILDKAKGKLLFIDEAYLLYNGGYKNGNNPYMQEAIVELLKYLEDVNNITIFAGYKEEMMKIYQTNPGIKSRIYKDIIFDDYSVVELYHILEKDLNKKGFSISGIHKPFIEKYINKMKEDKSFGNARSMKQLAQKLIINHANNYANKNTLEELVITRSDIPNDIKETKVEMGFGE